METGYERDNGLHEGHTAGRLQDFGHRGECINRGHEDHRPIFCNARYPGQSGLRRLRPQAQSLPARFNQS